MLELEHSLVSWGEALWRSRCCCHSSRRRRLLASEVGLLFFNFFGLCSQGLQVGDRVENGGLAGGSCKPQEDQGKATSPDISSKLSTMTSLTPSSFISPVELFQKFIDIGTDRLP